MVSSFKKVSHSIWEIFFFGFSCPVTTLKEVVIPLWVTGIPAYAGTEIADVIIEGKEGDSYTVSEAQNVNDKYELVEEKLPPSEGIIQKYNEEEPQEVIEGHVDDIYNTNTDYRRETISKDGKTYKEILEFFYEGTKTEKDLNFIAKNK